MVCNAPMDAESICAIKQAVEIPVVYTVVSRYMDLEPMLEAGVDFLNISGAEKTAEIVSEVRRRYPKIPIIATGGPTEDSILQTIRAGANAITYTPPTNGKIFAESMRRYRARYE